MFRRNTGWIPSIAVIDHTLECLTHIAAEDDRRVWLLHRFRSNVGFRDLKELPAEFHRIFRPDRLQHSNEFVRTPATSFKINSIRFDLIFGPTDPEPANHRPPESWSKVASRRPSISGL